jgi:hypothetical protein
MSEYCAVFSSYSWQRVIIFRWGIGPKKSTSVALHGFVISLGWPHVTSEQNLGKIPIAEEGSETSTG